MDVSIIICCYNGKSHLRPALEHIAHQQYDASMYVEFIFVDNASTDGSADYVKRVWGELNVKMPLRIVREAEPGLIYARQCGVRAARGKYIIFCDDDNWLREDYVQRAYELMEQMPNVGVLGGQSILAPGIEAPTWWAEQQGNYAVGKQLPQSGIANERGFLYGAGMVTRTELARKVFDDHYPFLLTGRKEDQTLSGEDWEYCRRIMLLGCDLYYSEKLFYWHDINLERLTVEQLHKLLQSFELSSATQEKYEYAQRFYKTSMCGRFGWLCIRIWNYVVASRPQKDRKRQLLQMHLCICGIYQDKEMNVIKGYIKSIAK